jgi:hypothetical protein
MSGYRIMSFDGGPAPLTVLPCLIEIERKYPGSIAATDLFVGASSGSWTALYLARNMGLVDSGKITGIELLQSCLAFLKSALAAMQPADPVKAWLDFLLGETPLLSYQDVQTVMTQPANYGQDTLGSLTSRRAVVIAGRAGSPWSPRVYDSADPLDARQLLYDVGLCSGSFPMVYAIRDGQVDGAMYTNNPAMVGLVQALAGAGKVGPVLPADARMFTLGSDDGSSNLSNLFLPGSRVSSDDAPEPAPAGGTALSRELAEIDEKLRGLVARLLVADRQIEVIVRALARKQGSGDAPLIDPRTADGLLKITQHLRGRIKTMRDELASPTRRAPAIDSAPSRPPAEQPWGWPQWTVFPLNFLYLLQVMLNSQGRGAGDQSRRLLGDRSLRLGPVSLLATNEAAMLLLLGLDDVVIRFGEITAALWKVSWPADFERWLGFQPGFTTSLSWIDKTWITG